MARSPAAGQHGAGAGSIDRGEVTPDVDIQALLDQIYAPSYFRLTMRHQPLAETLAQTLVRTVLDGVRTRST